MPFQKEGIKALTEGKQILGDDVGLGKTVQALVYCELMPYSKVLIVCPSPLKENWRDELLKFFNKEATLLNGKPKEREKIFKEYVDDPNKKYLIINYEQLSDRNKYITEFFFHCMVLDEAHRIKNFKTKTYKYGKKIQAGHKLALTATPITNHPMEVYSIANFVRKNYFNWYKFRLKYGIFGDVYKGPRLGVVQDVIAWKKLDELYEALKPVMIKRRKKDVLPDLPTRTYKIYHVELSPYERKVHDIYIDNMRDCFDTDDDQMFSYLSLAQQICNGTRLLSMSDSDNKIDPEEDKNSKLDVLKEVLEDLGEERAIIFTKFERMARIIRDEVGDRCFLITGATKDKIAAINEFKTSDKQYLVATDCLNYGVNLEFLKTLIHFDLAWTPAKMEQREGRIDRLTQKHKMLIVKLVTRNTFEDKITKLLAIKQSYIKDAVLGGVGMTDKEVIQEIFKINNNIYKQEKLL